MHINGLARRNAQTCKDKRGRIATMFRHRRQLRRWAAFVLLLWSFGVGVGVANACLAAHSTPAAGLATGLAAHCHGASQGHQHLASMDPPAQSGNPNCQDFCDKASVSIPSPRVALDDAQGHAFFPATVVSLVPAPTFAPVRLWMPRRDGVRAPPIQIAYLRLTL
jgi:hypothetical protein